jgi:hypothetical protein
VLPNALAVKVADADGTGLAGVSVTWAVTSGGGGLSTSAGTTDAVGIALCVLTLGTATGSNSVSATVAGMASIPAVTFSATAVPGPAAKLAFTVQPGSAAAGAVVSPAVQVTVQDSYGNTVTNSTAVITLAITSGTGALGAVLSGTLSAAAVNGASTFGTLAIDKAGSGYTLTATATGLTSATSGTFAVVPAAASKLVFGVQPSNATAGSAISPAVQVTVQDALGNTVTSSTASVSLAITSGTGTAGAVLGGTVTAAAANGVATFSNLTVNKVGTGYTLTATATGLTGVTSTGFSVAFGAASKLAFVAQPSSVSARSVMSPAVQVVVVDAQGNTVTNSSASVTLAITSGTGTAGAVLGGTLTVAAASGVATFGSLTVDQGGTGYTLTATSSGLTGAASTAFTVWPNFALDFNQSYVNVPADTAFNLTATWTLEAWVYPRNVASGTEQDIISKWDGPGDASYQLQIESNGAVRVPAYGGSSSTVALSRTKLVNNAWQHLAATFNNGEVRIYINGALDTVVTGMLTPMVSTQPLAFGREGAYAGYTYNGVIDEIRIWNVVRSASDLATFMNQRLAGTETGLKGYWRFDEGSGDVVLDATGRGNNGRLGSAVGPDTWDPTWTTNAAPIH